MDPQNRILLEQSFVALLEAQAMLGPLGETRTGVYVGCMYQEFTQLQYNLGYSITPAIATGNGISYLVGRVSYAFGLQGPCVSTDTACSSSLVAVDMAHKASFCIYQSCLSALLSLTGRFPPSDVISSIQGQSWRTREHHSEIACNNQQHRIPYQQEQQICHQ